MMLSQNEIRYRAAKFAEEWKDAKEFNASLSKSKNRDGSISLICRVPKPITDRLGSPSSIKFVISGKKIVVEASEK